MTSRTDALEKEFDAYMREKIGLSRGPFEAVDFTFLVFRYSVSMAHQLLIDLKSLKKKISRRK